MKILVTIFLVYVICIFSCSSQSIPDLLIKRNAIDLILLSEILDELTSEKLRYRVSEEVSPFYELGFLFQDYLPKEDFALLDYADLGNFDEIEEVKLKSISSDVNAELQFFFSENEKGYFIVEVFKTDIRMMKRSQIPDTGYSIAYLFMLKGKEIQLVHSMKVLYG